MSTQTHPELLAHVEVLRAMRTLFSEKRIPSPCEEREALDAAIAALSAQRVEAVIEPGAVHALVTAANAVLVENPHDDDMWSLEAAVAPFNASKPVECANGCPPQQVCDYCQIANPPQAQAVGCHTDDLDEDRARTIREAIDAHGDKHASHALESLLGDLAHQRDDNRRLYRITPQAQAGAGEVDWRRVESAASAYVEDYEMMGEDEQGREGSYTPNEIERMMILDAMFGLFSDDDFTAAIQGRQHE